MKRTKISKSPGRTDMPRGTKKDGTTCGRDLTGVRPTQKKIGEDPTRFGPGELARNPEMCQDILDKYLKQNWTAAALAS